MDPTTLPFAVVVIFSVVFGLAAYVFFSCLVFIVTDEPIVYHFIGVIAGIAVLTLGIYHTPSPYEGEAVYIGEKEIIESGEAKRYEYVNIQEHGLFKLDNGEFVDLPKGATINVHCVNSLCEVVR